jgi:polar amino acid transport system substrate-binding protein
MVLAVLLPRASAGGVAPPSVIHLASEDWEDYTAADGHGLGWDVLRKCSNRPASSSISALNPTCAPSAWPSAARSMPVGSYRDESSDCCTRAGTSIPITSTPWGWSAAGADPETLGNYRLAWVRGYDYQDYLPNVRHYAESSAYRHRSMLTHDRRLYIDALTEVDYVVSRAKDPSQFADPHRRTAAVPVLCRDPAGPR